MTTSTKKDSKTEQHQAATAALPLLQVAATTAAVSSSPLSPRQFSVVPLESHNNNNPSFISSPKPSFAASLLPRSSSSSASVADASREEQWRLAVAELSHKLIQATKKKEDAVTEASRLKTSMTELEKKLNKLEIYCHNLKSGLDECSSNNKKQSVPVRFNDGIIQQFLVSVLESRSSIRALSRALASQTRSCLGESDAALN
ncbi:unnamed protein product [Brassica oleracea]